MKACPHQWRGQVGKAGSRPVQREPWGDSGRAPQAVAPRPAWFRLFRTSEQVRRHDGPNAGTQWVDRSTEKLGHLGLLLTYCTGLRNLSSARIPLGRNRSRSLDRISCRQLRQPEFTNVGGIYSCGEMI
jgi:hypothetical protein